MALQARKVSRSFEKWPPFNLEMLVFVEGGNPESPEKNPRSKARTNNKLKAHNYGTWPELKLPTFVVGEPSHYCAIPAPQINLHVILILLIIINLLMIQGIS